MSNFDERAETVYCKTPWGQWAQAIEDITIEIKMETNIRAKDIICVMKPRFLSVSVSKKEILKAKWD